MVPNCRQIVLQLILCITKKLIKISQLAKMAKNRARAGKLILPKIAISRIVGRSYGPSRQSFANRRSKMGSAVVFRAFKVKNFYSIFFSRAFLIKVSVLLEQMARSMGRETPFLAKISLFRHKIGPAFVFREFWIKNFGRILFLALF